MLVFWNRLSSLGSGLGRFCGPACFEFHHKIEPKSGLKLCRLSNCESLDFHDPTHCVLLGFPIPSDPKLHSKESHNRPRKPTNFRATFEANFDVIVDPFRGPILNLVGPIQTLLGPNGPKNGSPGRPGSALGSPTDRVGPRRDRLSDLEASWGYF